MPRYQVTGTLKVSFDIEVDAEDEDEAAEKIDHEIDYEKLCRASSRATVDVDTINELPNAGAA